LPNIGLDQSLEVRRVSARGWSSIGNEPWVYRAASLDELPERHAETLDRALRDGESFRSLVYSPIWEGSETPFGLRGAPESHAIGLSDDRLLISSDPHIPGRDPRVTAIAIQSILRIECGSDLLQGWFAIDFESADKADRIALLHPSTKSHPLTELVREIRTCMAGGRLHHPSGRSPALRWEDVPAQLSSGIRSLVLADETLELVGYSSESWRQEVSGSRRKRWSVASPNGFFALGRESALAGIGETPPRPSVLVFGLRFLVLPYAGLRSIQVESRSTGDIAGLTLSLGQQNLVEKLAVSATTLDRGALEALIRIIEGAP
jgi:hypothetical protein